MIGIELKVPFENQYSFRFQLGPDEIENQDEFWNQLIAISMGWALGVDDEA